MLPPANLDPNSSVPLYKQLTDHIRFCIQTGRLSDGDRLPPTRELAGSLRLNRATVSAAYQALESEGLLRGHVGRGSFVQHRGVTPGPSGRRWDQFLMPGLDTGSGDITQTPPGPPQPQGTPQGTMISFATSRPSAALFPVDEFRAAANQVLASDRLPAILQLGSPYGYEPLRAWLRDQAREEGVARETDDIVITNGCQQALDLLERVLVTPGDTVAIEDPVYPGLRQVLARAGARAVGVPVDGSGVDLDALAAVLDHDRPKLLVLTPSFQNPTGGTMPLAAREAVVRLARARNVIVIESNIYGKLRYEGESLPTLKQIDASGDVIQLGSFSKIAFPGLRVGWVIAPRPLAAAIAQAKQWSDLHSNQLAQAILLRFAESGMLEAHRRRMIAAGALRLRAVLDACRQYLPAGSHHTHPQGGMNLWVRLPDPLDAAELLPLARRHGVTYLPGSYFGVSRTERGGLRLSFAGLSPEEIYKGIEALGIAAAAELRRGASQEVAEPSIALV